MKVAEATSVPFADSAADTASSAPIPGLAVGNKPAPGQTGPRGLAPRTNYSRVNTGSPLPADAGVSSQKSAPPDSQGFLPPKVAHNEVPMSGTMTSRMTIQQMIKAAGAGVQEQAAVALEAARQLANEGETPAAEKTAAPVIPSAPEYIPTSYVDKLAAAAEFVIANMQLAEEVETKTATIGEGPNHLQVMQATSSNNEIEAGHQGHATPAHVPPKNPGVQKAPNTSAGPATSLETNDKAMHPKQKHAGVSAAEIRKALSAKTASAPAAAAAEPSVDPRLVDGYLSAIKQAEDAINPAKISAGAAVAPETSMGGQPGGAPAGGQPQGPTGLVGSNDSARSYTKGQAKANVKADLSKYLTEPALSSAHDSTLNKALDNTGKAGVKIAHSDRALAARAILEKLAEEACSDEKTKAKKKESTGGMGTYTAPPVGGAAGAGM